MWRCNCFQTSLKWYICDHVQKWPPLKNPEKGKLLSDFRKMIHFWLPFRTMIDNFNHHQTWPPPLLKIEHLTKTNAKIKNKNSVECQLLLNFRELIQLWSSLSIMVNNSNFHQTWPPLLLKIESLKKIIKQIWKILCSASKLWT